jgi:voltage-gated potassium channel
MNNGDQDAQLRISPRIAVTQTAKVLWHLRGIVVILLLLFLILATVVYYWGGTVNLVTRGPSTMGDTLYFCAITALTIGYGDMVATTTLGRIAAVLLGLLGLLGTGVMTASAVYGIQAAARQAGLLPR